VVEGARRSFFWDAGGWSREQGVFFGGTWVGGGGGVSGYQPHVLAKTCNPAALKIHRIRQIGC
jgi:hypothetical protein